ncbi:WAT1-related protein [Melia azedarach]|uniref:WAT1-related protein n=2 Tax=Melia azedarach TaxID=155640 RepID=A0ACC1XLD3_MELAZ|nr:WAT1-related protein [Melia azedarach]KAJ4711151.1 WAT1-related protein [Melia azedarach]
MGIHSMRAALPFAGMVMVILVQVSNMVVIKEAMSKGINKYVIVVYSDALSCLIFLFSSLAIHRSERPRMTILILCKMFLLSAFGCSADIFSYIGLQYSSPTLNTAMINLVPAFTFVLAVSFRMEKLNWRSKSSQAKSLGTLVSIAGAFVVTFYEGPTIIRRLTATDTTSLDEQLLSPQSNWILGGFFLAIEAFLLSAWYILQALVLKEFPALSITLFFQSLFGTILSTIFTLIMVTDPSAWKLRPDIGLFAIVYSSVIRDSFQTSLLLWCLMRIGPLYVSMFKPLSIVFSILMGVIILGEQLFLGSLIGAVIIITGFYAVMWGRAKEQNTIHDSGVRSSESSGEKLPLLQNSAEE